MKILSFSTIIKIAIPIILLSATCKKKDDTYRFSKDYLVVNYLFKGNANDQSDSAFHGTVYGPVLTSGRNDKENEAYLFDGLDDYIKLPPQVALNTDTSFSIEAWISKDCYTSDGKYFDDGIYGQTDGEEGSDYPLVAFEVNGNKTVRGVIRGTDNPALNVYTTDTIQDDTWNHIVLVWNSEVKILALYMNGNLAVQNSDVLVGNTLSNDYVSIGAIFDDLQTLYHFYCGKIDELRIWRKALTQSEIRVLKEGNYKIE